MDANTHHVLLNLENAEIKVPKMAHPHLDIRINFVILVKGRSISLVFLRNVM